MCLYPLAPNGWHQEHDDADDYNLTETDSNFIKWSKTTILSLNPCCIIIDHFSKFSLYIFVLVYSIVCYELLV